MRKNIVMLFRIQDINLSSWCLVMVERLFLAVPRACLQFVIVVFPDHTHLLFRHTCVALLHKKTVLSLETSSEINFEFIKFVKKENVSL